MSVSPIRLAALVAGLALAGACSDSTGPSDVQPSDLSAVLGELQPSSLAPAVAAISPVPVPSFTAPAPSSCSYDGASKSFVCPNVTISGITVSRTFTLLDANGTPQTAFDRTSTAAVRMITALTGTITTATMTATVDQQQDVTLSGLLTGMHTLNGTSATRTTGTFGTGTAALPIDVSMSATITNLVLPRSSTGSQWPQSGTITSTITESGLAMLTSPSTTMTVTVAFNGTSMVTVTTTIGGFTTTSKIDLANPRPIRGWRRADGGPSAFGPPLAPGVSVIVPGCSDVAVSQDSRRGRHLRHGDRAAHPPA